MTTVEKMITEMDDLSLQELGRLQTALEEKLMRARTEQEREDQFERMLLEKGIISSLPNRRAATPAADRPAPIKIEGEPLSETIIRERR